MQRARQELGVESLGSRAHDRAALATAAVLSGDSSVQEAAAEHGVSRSAVYTRLRAGHTDIKTGRRPLVTEDAFKGIATWVREATARGECISTTELSAGASRIASDAHGRLVTLSKSSLQRLVARLKEIDLSVGSALSMTEAKTEANSVAHVGEVFDQTLEITQANTRIMRGPLRQSLTEDLAAIMNIAGDTSRTISARMVAIHALACVSRLPLNILQGHDNDRRTKKNVRVTKVKQPVVGDGALETAIGDKRDAAAAAAKEKSDAKTAKAVAAKAASKESTKTSAAQAGTAATPEADTRGKAKAGASAAPLRAPSPPQSVRNPRKRAPPSTSSM
jgi:hypothetical protein